MNRPPDELLDLFAERVHAQPRDERAAALGALIAELPAAESALRALHAELEATERWLDGGFGPLVGEAPRELGPFRVLRTLGAGAFGEVYLAEQARPVRREVAVKVLRPGVADASILERFSAEGQLLAALHHPSIVHVLDAGKLPDGRPWFAMEYVAGEPITRYCDARSLDLTARLHLFVELCRGVQHAHASGIVHRDLKPANVLVVEHAGRPLPKVIDFGIAKVLLSAVCAPRDRATETGRIVGTPGYMSPEQARGAPDSVDARTDVYALGILLCELLSGTRPFGERSPTSEEDAPPPSRLLADTGDGAQLLAARRATDPRRLRQALRGDLDHIVGKALRPEREERYASAAALAADLERHLRAEPIEAGSSSTTDRLRRIARRHRTALVAAGAFALLLALGLYLGSTLLERAEASEAERFGAALAAAETLLARASDPRLLDAPESEELRRALLEDALALEERARAARSDDPTCRALRARTLGALANAHYGLARYAEGERAAAEAAREGEALAREGWLDDAGQLALARAHHLRAKCLLERKELPAALEASQAALGRIERTRDPDAAAPHLAQFLVVHANLLGRTGAAAEELAAQCRAIELLERRRAAGAGDAATDCDLVRFHCGLSRIHLRRGEHELAEGALREAQRCAESSELVGDEERGLVRRRLGQLLAARGRPREALEAYGAAIAILERELARHPGRELVRYQLALDRCASAEQRAALGEREAALAEARRAIAAADALAPHFSGRTWKLAEILRRSAVALSEGAPSEPRGPLLTADAWLARALELATGTSSSEPDAARLAQLRFQASVDRGLLAEQLGTPLSAEAWEEIVALGAAGGVADYRAIAAAALEAARAR